MKLDCGNFFPEENSITSLGRLNFRSIMRANPQALIQHLVLIHVFCIFPDAKNPSIAKVRYAVN